MIVYSSDRISGKIRCYTNKGMVFSDIYTPDNIFHSIAKKFSYTPKMSESLDLAAFPVPDLTRPRYKMYGNTNHTEIIF